MELQGIITGTIRNYEVHADSSNDGKTANVRIEVVLDEEAATKLGGKLFAKTCFSDFVGKSAAATVDSKKLGGELAIKAEHTIVIADYTLLTKPKLTGVSYSKESRSVTVTMQLTIPGSAKKLRHMLDDSCGDDIEIEIKGLTQTEVPGADDERHDFSAAKKGNGASDPTPKRRRRKGADQPEATA